MLMTTKPKWKRDIHDLHEKYYSGRIERVPQSRPLCIRCGKPRVLGKRKPGKGKCKQCRIETRSLFPDI